jgi:hypothetical protein
MNCDNSLWLIAKPISGVESVHTIIPGFLSRAR